MTTNPRKRPAIASLINAPASKTQKTSSSSGTTSIAELEKQLSLFTRERLQKVLLTVAKDNPIVAAAINKEVAAIQKVMAQAPAIDFQPLSKSVWKLLNVTYKSLRPSQQFGVVGGIESEIESVITEDILAKVTRDVCFDTKFNAISVLRKIGKSIMLTEPGEIAKGVQNGTVPDVLVDAMKRIAEMMTEQERKDTRWKGDLLEELEELNELRDCYMEDLPEVLELFGMGDRGDEDDEDDEEDEDDDGDMRREVPRSGLPFDFTVYAPSPHRTAAGPKQKPTGIIDLTD